MRFDLFAWFRSKPDPQLEAMKEKVARADQTIEATDDILKEAIRRTNGAFVRMEKRTAVEKRRLEDQLFADLYDGWGRRHD